jgi:O-antigen/teichoic acid export membrane protein
LLGAEGYGVLILVGLIPTYLGFADFGMSMASTKFGSEAYAEGDEEKEARIVRTAALIALLSSVPVATLLIIFAGSVIGLFNVPPDYIAEATLALRLAAVTFVINILCGIFNTPQLARLRMDLNTLINAVPRILGLIATPIVIYLGYGIVGAITVLLIASAVNLVGHLIVSRRLLPLLLRRGYESTLFRPLIRFGGGLVFAASAAMIVANSEKAILPVFVSVEALAYYSVAFTLASMATLFAQAMIQSLIPAFSQLQGEEKREQLGNLFFRGLRLNLLLLLPTFFLLSLLAQPFFSIWAGPEFGANSSVPFYVLLAGLVFNIPAYLPYSLIMARGRSDLFAKLYALEVVPYLGLVFILTSKWGIIGAAAAWSTRMIIDAILQFIIANSISVLSFPVRNLCRQISPGLLLVGGLLIGIAFYDTWWVVITVAVISLIGYLLVALKVAFEKEELEFAKHQLFGAVSRFRY